MGRMVFLSVLTISSSIIAPIAASAQESGDFRTTRVELRAERHLGRPSKRMVETVASASTVDALRAEDRARSMAWLPVDFHDGTIEVDVASEIAPGAPDYARGFVGLAFRIDAEGRHESIYLRPANSTVDDQVRRNHTVQYASYPKYDFQELRNEAPEKYETFADIALGRWIHMKVVVRGSQVRLYVDGATNPAMIVTDMKLGPDQRGGVGITPGPGSIVHFRGLRIISD